jgi:EAL domain-containing protein (putative c-di-GMP-specific phosphodiesterase class I)
LRWNHPELGLIPPDRFIPVAEEARLISRIGEWVMHTACREAAQWPSHIHVTVNLSVEQLLDPRLAETIVSALAHSGLAPARLELEITESIFLRNRDAALATLDRLAILGVRISLDDFGTSYSSFGVLGQTRFNTIKIDRRYVRDAGLSMRESVAVIRAVVAMAESLGMTITAEGAESDEELARIRELGCDQVQGYFFSHPVTPAELRRLFIRHRPGAASSAA